MTSGTTFEREQLLSVIRLMRRRWQLRILMTGLAVLAGGAVIVGAGSAFAIHRFRFDPGVVLTLKFAAWIAVAVLAGRFLIRPLRRRVTDPQVALYLEEHEPGLGGVVVGAVEFGGGQSSGRPSRALIERLIERAIWQCAEVEGGRRVERRGLRRSSGALAGVAVVGALLLAGGPPWLSRGAAVLLPWRPAATANPYRIDVFPGDTVVARGSDLRVDAALAGFAAGGGGLGTRRGAPGGGAGG